MAILPHDIKNGDNMDATLVQQNFVSLENAIETNVIDLNSIKNEKVSNSVYATERNRMNTLIENAYPYGVPYMRFDNIVKNYELSVDGSSHYKKDYPMLDGLFPDDSSNPDKFKLPNLNGASGFQINGVRVYFVIRAKEV